MAVGLRVPISALPPMLFNGLADARDRLSRAPLGREAAGELIDNYRHGELLSGKERAGNQHLTKGRLERTPRLRLTHARLFRGQPQTAE